MSLVHITKATDGAGAVTYTCQHCSLSTDDQFDSASAALRHVREHEACGDDVSRLDLRTLTEAAKLEDAD